MRLRAALIALMLGGAAGAVAAPERAPMSDAARALVGTWEFSNADRDRVCAVTFHDAPSARGSLRLEFEPECRKLYPFVADIVGWRMAENDFLRLLDGRGETVLDFSEVESGVYEAPRPGEGILFIQSPDVAEAESGSAVQVAGEYELRRADKPLCVLALTDVAAGEAQALEVREPCDILVKRFAPVAWQVEQGELTLANAKGEVWRFEEDGDAWRRVPQTAAMTLVRR